MNVLADQKEPSTSLNILCYLEMAGKSEFPALQTIQTHIDAAPVPEGSCVLAAFMLDTKPTHAAATSAYRPCIGLGFIAFLWKFSSVLNLPLFKC